MKGKYDISPNGAGFQGLSIPEPSEQPHSNGHSQI